MWVVAAAVVLAVVVVLTAARPAATPYIEAPLARTPYIGMRMSKGTPYSAEKSFLAARSVKYLLS